MTSKTWRRGSPAGSRSVTTVSRVTIWTPRRPSVTTTFHSERRAMNDEAILADVVEEGLAVYWCPECKASQSYATHKVSVGLTAVTKEHTCVVIDVASLIKDNNMLAEALEFYADPLTYMGATIE